MSLYPESRFPVRDEITLVHTSQLRNISSPGTWFSGQERRAIAVAARNAGVAAGLIERPEISESEDSPVPAHIQKVVATIAADVHALKQSFYEQALADGLTDSEYVEIVGVVSRLVDLDVFARGIGVTPRSLPEAASGQPTRERPQTAVVEQAWVPTIPNGPEGGEVGAGLYHGQPMPYIVRSLSLVPEELRAHVELETAHYTRLDKLFDYQYQHHDGLTRPQAELVAGRVSALNDCFY